MPHTFLREPHHDGVCRQASQPECGRLLATPGRLICDARQEILVWVLLSMLAQPGYVPCHLLLALDNTQLSAFTESHR